MKPSMRGLVVYMRGVAQREQHIDIEQMDAQGEPSRSRFTRSSVTTFAGEVRGNKGTPFRSPDARRGARALRTKSEKTLPADTRR